jgi:hypothetical protein
MIQQGQVFKFAAKGADGQSLWAYRYRLEGRSSARPQVGGFATRAEAQKALRLERRWGDDLCDVRCTARRPACLPD